MHANKMRPMDHSTDPVLIVVVVVIRLMGKLFSGKRTSNYGAHTFRLGS